MKNKSYIYGIHSVQAALEQQPEQIQTLYILENRGDKRLAFILELAQQKNIPSTILSRQKLDTLVNQGNHQGVVLQCLWQKNWSEDELENLLDQATGKTFLLILDGVQDPHNLGACLRSANGAGVDAVIVPKDRAVGLTSTVRKVASGAAEETPLIAVTNLARTLQWLKQRGIWLYGTSDTATQALYATDLSGPLGLVLGSEDKGLRRLTTEHCDTLMSIPMSGSVNSLNVSVAAGICLYEVVRQRMVHYRQ